ncbi:MAG: protein kinase domain-containing protein [Planctomycetales bacterium]
MEKRWIWPFELEEQIGSGAMGVVYRARSVTNNKRVALKLLPADVAANATLAARFQREMELLKELRHPHIVHCYGGKCEGDDWFYAMELVEGGTLAGLLQDQGRLPWRRVVDLALQVCEALQYAHDRGIIHRDLKPGNLLLTKSGKVKLSDFGLAQIVAETKLTAAGKTVGSLHYMAPEQIHGKGELSNRTDLYALGCTLFELLTGRPPFEGESVAEVLRRHVREAPQPVSSLALDVPPQIDMIVAELLAKDPQRRPPDAEAVAKRLREIDHSVTIKVPRFDKHRPFAKVPDETMSAEIPAATWSMGKVSWVLWGMTLALLVAIGIAASSVQSGQPLAQTEAQLVAGLQDPQPAVRAFAARTLGESGPAAGAAVPRLVGLLEDSDPQVRAAAAQALGQIGPATDTVLAPLRKTQRTDESPQVREAAAQAERSVHKVTSGSSVWWWLYWLFAGGLLVGGAVWIWRQGQRR